MSRGRLLVALLLIFVTSCAPAPSFRQPQALLPSESNQPEKALVIFAVDLREQTSFHDVSQVGDIFFRKVDESYQTRPENDYDFGIQGSVGADWNAAFGGEDQNKAPHLFAIDPGTYVIERINIGAGPTTTGPGYDQITRRAGIGTFAVRPGEVVNLGRLVVHMHYYEGYFAAEIDDNSSDARQFLLRAHPELETKIQNRFLTAVPKFPFHQ